MINNDILIKIVRSRGHKKTWPEQVNKINQRIDWIKRGFPGIGNDHLSFVLFKDIKPGDLFIYDEHLESNSDYGDEAPLMLKVLDGQNCKVEGIGLGADSIRDPDRTKIRWKDIIPLPPLSGDFLVLKVNPNPSLNGGGAYYYFYKSYRDFRD